MKALAVRTLAALVAAFVAPTTSALSAPVAADPAPATATCPDFLPAETRCWTGRAAKGGFYWIAVPKGWNGALIVHAHGGPRTGAPEANDPLEDLERFSMTVQEGFAWAGSTYRRGGYGVRMAAEDTEDLRQIFWDAFGRPRRTLLHGQSWGGQCRGQGG